MKNTTSKILHHKEYNSNKIYILSITYNRHQKYELTGYYGAYGTAKLQTTKKGSFGSFSGAEKEMLAIAETKRRKDYRDITNSLPLFFPYDEYLSFEEGSQVESTVKKVNIDNMTNAEILAAPMSQIIENIECNFEDETPEDAYNEGLKLASAMKGEEKADRKIAVAKSILRFGHSFLVVNSLDGEDEVDNFENSIRIKAIIERGSIELKESAIEELMNRLKNGIDDVQDKSLHLDLVEKFLPNSKVAQEEIFEVAVCLDNIGMEDKFDVGVGYCFEENTKGLELIKVFDKVGNTIECNNERFKIEREEVED